MPMGSSQQLQSFLGSRGWEGSSSHCKEDWCPFPAAPQAQQYRLPCHAGLNYPFTSVLSPGEAAAEPLGGVLEMCNITVPCRLCKDQCVRAKGSVSPCTKWDLCADGRLSSLVCCAARWLHAVFAESPPTQAKREQCSAGPCRNEGQVALKCSTNSLNKMLEYRSRWVVFFFTSSLPLVL